MSTSVSTNRDPLARMLSRTVKPVRFAC